MHSRRALVGLGLTAVILSALVLLDLARPPAPGGPDTRSLLPGLGARAERIARIAWFRPESRPGSWVLASASAETFELSQGAGGFDMHGVERARIDQDAVRQVFATLAILRHVRSERGPAAAFGLDQPHFILRLELDDGRAVALHVGRHVQELDRVWLARVDLPAAAQAGHEREREAPDQARPALLSARESVLAYLVDGHAVRMLDLGPLDVRSRRVFPVFWQDVSALEVRAAGRALEISGQPPALRMSAAARPDAVNALDSAESAAEAAASIAVDPERWGALTRALGQLHLARFVDPREGLPEHAPAYVRLVVHTRGDTDPPRTYRLVELGPCPISSERAERLVATIVGLGCVDADSLESLARAFADPTSLLARHAFTGHPIALTFEPPGATAVDVRAAGGSWTWDLDAPIEPAAVDEWLELLGRASTGRYWWPSDPARARATPEDLTLLATIQARYTDRSSERITLFEYRTAGQPGYLARRGQEPAYLMLESARVLMPVSTLRWRRRQVLALEPYSLREAEKLERGSVTSHLVRGELLDDWHVRAPAGRAVRTGLIERLRELARLRARSFERPTPLPSDELDPPRARVRLYFDPGPDGPGPLGDPPIIHELDIGRTVDSGCLARLDHTGPVFSLAGESCKAVGDSWLE